MFSSVHNEKLVKYILPQDFTRWRPTPADPYIYVSFSSKYLADSHCSQALDILKKGLIDFNSDVIEEIKSILQESWGKLAPIRYLDQHVTEEEIKNKNIIFVVGHSLSYKDHQLKYGYSLMDATIEYGYTEMDITSGLNNNFVNCKFIRFSKLSSSHEIDARFKYVIHHEFGHGIVGLKHPIYYEYGDKGPFNKNMKCTDTVMAYEQDCPGALTKNIYPDMIGPVDWLATQYWLQDFEDKNRQETEMLEEQASLASIFDESERLEETFKIRQKEFEAIRKNIIKNSKNNKIIQHIQQNIIPVLEQLTNPQNKKENIEEKDIKAQLEQVLEQFKEMLKQFETEIQRLKMSHHNQVLLIAPTKTQEMGYAESLISWLSDSEWFNNSITIACVYAADVVNECHKSYFNTYKYNRLTNCTLFANTSTINTPSAFLPLGSNNTLTLPR
jgi:hypothetical protein